MIHIKHIILAIARSVQTGIWQRNILGKGVKNEQT